MEWVTSDDFDAFLTLCEVKITKKDYSGVYQIAQFPAVETA